VVWLGEGPRQSEHGVAFERYDVDMSIIIPEGISVSGRLSIMLRTGKAEVT
jgi:hypothetical protein